jgi:hypothetical protein
VFTARYGLIPYIKQITLIFKMLMFQSVLYMELQSIASTCNSNSQSINIPKYGPLLYTTDHSVSPITFVSKHNVTEVISFNYPKKKGHADGGAVGWCTALQAGRSRVRFPDGLTGIFHWQSFRLHYGPGIDSAFNTKEYQEYFLGVKAAGAYGWPYNLHVLIVLKSGSLNLLEPSRLNTDCFTICPNNSGLRRQVSVGCDAKLLCTQCTDFADPLKIQAAGLLFRNVRIYEQIFVLSHPEEITIRKGGHCCVNKSRDNCLTL